MAKPISVDITDSGTQQGAGIFALLGIFVMSGIITNPQSLSDGSWVARAGLGGAALLFAGLLYAYAGMREMVVNSDDCSMTISTLFGEKEYQKGEILCVLVKCFRQRVFIISLLDKNEDKIIDLPHMNTYEEAVRKAGLLGGALGINAIDSTGVKQEGLRQLPTQKPR